MSIYLSLEHIQKKETPISLDEDMGLQKLMFKDKTKLDPTMEDLPPPLSLILLEILLL
jgi:hypothetical protein